MKKSTSRVESKQHISLVNSMIKDESIVLPSSFRSKSNISPNEYGLVDNSRIHFNKINKESEKIKSRASKLTDSKAAKNESSLYHEIIEVED